MALSEFSVFSDRNYHYYSSALNALQWLLTETHFHSPEVKFSIVFLLLKVWDFADLANCPLSLFLICKKELEVNTCTGSCEPSLWLNTLMLFFSTDSNFYTLHTDTPSLSYQELLSQDTLTSPENWTIKHRKTAGILNLSLLMCTSYCVARSTKYKM